MMYVGSLYINSRPRNQGLKTGNFLSKNLESAIHIFMRYFNLKIPHFRRKFTEEILTWFTKTAVTLEWQGIFLNEWYHLYGREGTYHNYNIVKKFNISLKTTEYFRILSDVLFILERRKYHFEILDQLSWTTDIEMTYRHYRVKLLGTSNWANLYSPHS